MAVPKRKVSKARRDKRRSAVWKLDTPAFPDAHTAASWSLLTRFARTADITRALR